MKRVAILIVFLSSLAGLFAQKENPYIRNGNKAYAKQDFDKAKQKYQQALGKNPKSEKAIFNLGDVNFRNKDYEDAEKHFSTIAHNLSLSKDVRAGAYYNLGNTYLSNKKIDEAIQAYKQSLKLNPKDMDAKYNLAYALKMKKQQQKNKNNKDKKNQDKKNQDKKDKDKKNQDKKDQDKKNKDKKNQDKNKQDKKEQQKQDKKNQEKQKQDKKEQDQQNQQKQGQQPKPEQMRKAQKMSKKEADKMLKALNNKEKKTLLKVKKAKQKKAKSKKVEKDW